MGIELNEDQIFGIYDAENWWHKQEKQVFEISGGAGTGKTTMILYLIEKLGLKLENVLFVAFMGKAVSVLSKHGLPAKTIHSTIYKYVKEPEYDENGKKVRTETGKVKMKLTKQLKANVGKHIKLIVIDEGSMVSKDIAEDLLSFGISVIVLGDLNQLPPVFGNPYFLNKPDVVLRKIMRQAEDNPIIWLAQEILNGHRLRTGVYGHSAVVNRDELNSANFDQTDICLTGTNELRYMTNKFYRESLYRIERLDYPHMREKIICRKNNWSKEVDGFYLTNGTTGIVSHIEKSSCNGKTMIMDFKPDFTKNSFKNIKFDYRHLNAKFGEEDDPFMALDSDINKIEYAYAITVHSSQGSQWERVLLMGERFMNNLQDHRRFMYTGITRASEMITIAI